MKPGSACLKGTPGMDLGQCCFEVHDSPGLRPYAVKNFVIHAWEPILAAGKIGDSPIKSDIKFGSQTHLGAESQSKGTIQLVPKSWKMAKINPRRRGGTWQGVPVAIWCSEWICKKRGWLVHHTIMIPAVLSLQLLRGACSRSCTDKISKWMFLYQNLLFFPVSNFFDC
jgi:hypothetical protein